MLMKTSEAIFVITCPTVTWNLNCYFSFYNTEEYEEHYMKSSRSMIT